MTLSLVKFDGTLSDLNMFSAAMTRDLQKSEPALYNTFQMEGEGARKHFIATQYYFWKAQRDIKGRDNFNAFTTDLRKVA